MKFKLKNYDDETKNYFGQLRQNCLEFPEVLAQSIAVIAPTASPAINIPLVYASAFTGTWVSYMIATIGLIFVSLNINQFACQSASPGSLYIYVSKGLGSSVGLLVGWALILGYIGTAIATVFGFVNYGSIALASIGIQAPTMLLLAVCIGVAWFCAYKDIRLSTNTMLCLEFISIGAILLLAIATLIKYGGIDVSQIVLKNSTQSGIRLGLVLAIFSFVGFESATSLGIEAKKPLKNIPRSVILSTVLTGIFFVVMSYVEVLGFSRQSIALDKADAPLTILASATGVGFLGKIISVCVAVCFFSCTLGCMNAVTRIVYSLAKRGLFHEAFGVAHKNNGTPHVAVTMISCFVFLFASAMAMFGIKPIDGYNYAGTFAVFGFLPAYIFVSVAAPFQLYKSKKLRDHHIVTSVIAVLFMLLAIYGSVFPIPPFPYNIFLPLFLLSLMFGCVWFLILKQHKAELIKSKKSSMLLDILSDL